MRLLSPFLVVILFDFIWLYIWRLKRIILSQKRSLKRFKSIFIVYHYFLRVLKVIYCQNLTREIRRQDIENFLPSFQVIKSGMKNFPRINGTRSAEKYYSDVLPCVVQCNVFHVSKFYTMIDIPIFNMYGRNMFATICPEY